MKRRRRKFRPAPYYSRAHRAHRARLDRFMVEGHYLLGPGGVPVPCRSLGLWARRWPSQRRIADDRVGAVRVSTIFLGLDTRGLREPGEPPIVFESMVFRDSDRGPIVFRGSDGKRYVRDRDWTIVRSRRYSTRAEARAGHAELVAWVRQGLN